ncbi:MAG: tRNA (adenosine(37)-N6)-dimethylallyltransferase MiaA [Planctomycetota bacterium]
MRTYPSLLGRVTVVTGPTASGKTDVAVEMARRVGACRSQPFEIISLDSMAVYRGMDIGTAKASTRQRDTVPHHLIDVVNPDREFSVAEYLRLAHQCVNEIEQRGHRVLFVGGTPMYLKAILNGFDPGPPADPVFRQRVADDVAQFGLPALHQRLTQVDPISASRIDANDERRMTRALEFAYLTGQPISHAQTQFTTSSCANAGGVFALRTPRPTLHNRIGRRIERMFALGLVDEVRGLLARYGSLSKTARAGVGYRELIEIASQEQPDKEAIDQAHQRILFHTRRMVRRQETWLRSLPEMKFIDTADRTVDDLADTIVARLPSN